MVERKLTTIFCADVVGYSRLMETDEEATLARLKSYRELIQGLIGQHGGRVFGGAGDSIVAEFPSTVEAVRCAVEGQQALATRNAELVEDRRMRFRIGINLGDVMVEGNDLLGGGVNVAARLEALAEPGGICISRTARDQVRDKLGLPFDDMGGVKVKNIARPVRVFQIMTDEQAGGASRLKATPPAFRRLAALAAVVAVVVAAAAVAIWLKPWAPAEPPAPVQQAALQVPDKPSIVVLPFTNMSGDPEQEYFADGITDDITTELSRFRGLFVIARNSAFTYKGKAVNVRDVGRELGLRYALEGSVRRSGDTVRINAQLVDAATGEHLWAERYDRDMRDVFAVQDEVTQKIVSAIGTTRLRDAWRERVARKNPEDLEAYDLFLQALDLFLRFTPEDNAEARRLHKRAIELDPSYARPHGGLAWTHLQEVFLGWSPRPAESLQSALASAQRAVALDDTDAQAHWALGAVYLYMGQHDRALAAYERDANDAGRNRHRWRFSIA